MTVTISRRILKDEVISLINSVQEEYQLRQKEVICLGLIAQHTMLSAIELSRLLDLPTANGIRDWLGRLLDLKIILYKGKTKGVEYFVNPELLRKAKFTGKTNLKKIEPHRLRELIYLDVQTYPESSIREIRQRVGLEIPPHKIKQQLYLMVENQTLITQGALRWRKYSIAQMT